MCVCVCVYVLRAILIEYRALTMVGRSKENSVNVYGDV